MVRIICTDLLQCLMVFLNAEAGHEYPVLIHPDGSVELIHDRHGMVLGGMSGVKYPEYELLDDEKVAAVIPEEGLKSYDQATLKDLCEKTDSEIVVAMRLDEIKEKPINFRREPSLGIFMKGEYASYNRLTGKYYHKKLYYRDEIEEVLTVKSDWQQMVFASELKRYINRTLKLK